VVLHENDRVGRWLKNLNAIERPRPRKDSDFAQLLYQHPGKLKDIRGLPIVFNKLLYAK
jgi:hypothetical protein